MQRNGGRSGARWAPQALLATLGKMAAPDARQLYCQEVTHAKTEAQDYLLAAQAQTQKLRALLAHGTRLLHIGGGHDHVLPLLLSLDDGPVCVLNVDAHLDTRVDPESHSGNPFRQFDRLGQHPWQLHQIGIHPFANSLSTQAPLQRGTQHILWRRQCDDPAWVRGFLQRLENDLVPGSRVVFSLDCDALAGADVEAVSAPNHDGLSLAFVRQLMAWYRNLCQRRGLSELWGVYEFNPLYDSTSSRSARAVAGLLYGMLY